MPCHGLWQKRGPQEPKQSRKNKEEKLGKVPARGNRRQGLSPVAILSLQDPHEGRNRCRRESIEYNENSTNYAELGNTSSPRVRQGNLGYSQCHYQSIQSDMNLSSYPRPVESQ